jgi:hypothetical protein
VAATIALRSNFTGADLRRLARGHHERMTTERAAATTRGAGLSNPAALIKASANRRWAIGIEANAARAKKRDVDLEPVIRAIHGDGKTLLMQADRSGAEQAMYSGGTRRPVV